MADKEAKSGKRITTSQESVSLNNSSGRFVNLWHFERSFFLFCFSSFSKSPLSLDFGCIRNNSFKRS